MNVNLPYYPTSSKKNILRVVTKKCFTFDFYILNFYVIHLKLLINLPTVTSTKDTSFCYLII